VRVHDDELDIDEPLVRALLSDQFPQWADLPLVRAGDGTVNVIYRLGDALSIRLPRRDGPEAEDDLEFLWLPVLAPHLPVAIPQPVARGRPGDGYPWYWSIHTWLDGELPDQWLAPDEVADFVEALQRIDAAGGPAPVVRPLSLRDANVRQALERVEAPGALELWERTMTTPEWHGAPVWVHRDLDRRNVLVRDGRLAGVLDWGGVALGDPAFDVMVAWKLLAPAERDAFRERLRVDDATWLRAQGRLLAQSVIALGYYTPESNPPIHAEATRWLAEVLG
jgi:aminoglycoside phosphotransferase (APT) family kinase protein